MRFFLLLCVFLFTSLSLSAQENVTYRLRVPSFEDFYAEMMRIREEESSYLENSQTAYAVAVEAQVRYVEPGLLNVTQIEALYDIYAAYFEPSGLFKSTRYTQSELSTLWLRELIALQLPEDIARITSRTNFGPFRVEWTQNDFASVTPGSIGYRLDVYRDNVYLQTLLLEIVEDTYRFVDLPVMPMRINLEVIKTQRLWGFIEVTEFTNRVHMGRLFVVMPSPGRLNLAASIGYEEPPGEFPPLYNDFTFMGTTEYINRKIQHHRLLSDSWGCQLTRVIFYEFDEEQNRYMQTTPAGDLFLPDSIGCFLRQADMALSAERYTEAIDFYERAFALAEERDDPNTESSEDFTYYQARLLLAYLLTDQPEKATALVGHIPEYDNTFSKAVVDAFQSEQNIAAVCQAAYDFVFTHPSGFYQDDRQSTYDGIFRGAYMGSPLILESVACNLAKVVDQLISDHTFTTAQTPLEQLADLGLTTQDHLMEDMNSDGQVEYLVWISPGIDPIFFSPHDGEYITSRYYGKQDPAFRSADLRAPDTDNVYSFITLPGDAGRALVNLDIGYDRYSELSCGQCGGGGPQPYCQADAFVRSSEGRIGDLTIWYLDGSELTIVHRGYHCQDTDIAALFLNGSTAELYAAATHYDDSDPWSILIYPAVYRWDSGASHYLLFPPPTPTPIPIATATPNPMSLVPLAERPVFSYQWMDDALIAGDTAVALEMADYYITNTTYELSTLNYHYYRALALEALNRPEEALAEYIAIYEAAPDSAWGMLAALHLEVIETE